MFLPAVDERSIFHFNARDFSAQLNEIVSDGGTVFPSAPSRTVHLDIIKVFYLPTDAQENCFKKNITIYITTAWAG